MGAPGQMMPGLDPNQLSARDMEMIQTSQMFQQFHALEHSKVRAFEACFDKCLDVDDLQSGTRMELEERKRQTEYKKEKLCMSLCHKKYQKGFSMAAEAHQTSALNTKLMEYVQRETPGLNLTAAE